MKTQVEVSLRRRIQSWLTQLGVRHVVLVISALILVALVVGFSGHEIGSHITSLESWVTELGPSGMLVFVGLVVVGTSLFLPESLFGVAAGVLFGFTWGAAVMVLASVLAAALQYGLACRLLREPIRRKLGGGKMSAVIQGVARGGNVGLQLLLRLTPMNQTIISYSLGASGVRFPQFLAATIAMLPAILVEVYLGHTGKHLALISAGGTHAGWRHDVFLFTGLLAAAIGVGYASRAAYRSVLRNTNVSE